MTDEEFYKTPLLIYCWSPGVDGPRWTFKIKGDPGIGLTMPKTWLAREAIHVGDWS